MDMIDDVHPAPPPHKPFNLANWGLPFGALPEPGIYFNLPEEDYHRWFAMSASGVKLMRSSALDWWARSPLNPALEQVLEEETDSAAQLYGRALHKLVLEGEQAFNNSFVPPCSKSDHHGALDTAADMKNFIETLNESREKPDKLKKTGTKDELATAILNVAPRTPIWETIVENYARANAGKEFLKQPIIDAIRTAARMISSDPNMRDIFTNGLPEVSIFYYCQHTGIPCKARWDYLKTDEITDLKSYQDLSMRPIDEAVTREMNTRSYSRQASWYLESAAYIPAMIKAGRVFGDVDKAFLDNLMKHKGKRFRFVFSRKGAAPLARARWFSQELGAFELAKSKNNTVKDTFAYCLEHFGKDIPWIESQPTRDFTDDEFADWSF